MGLFPFQTPIFRPSLCLRFARGHTSTSVVYLLYLSAFVSLSLVERLQGQLLLLLLRATDPKNNRLLKFPSLCY